MSRAIRKTKLDWEASHNGISVSVSMDIRIHPANSDSVVVILPGVDGSVDGYRNKYVRMADNIISGQNKVVVRASNNFISSFHWEDNFRRLIEFVNNNAKEIAGTQNIKLEVIAHSAGASVASWLAWEYPNITKLLLINPAEALHRDQILNGLERFKGEAIIVYGGKDPSGKFHEAIPEKHKKIVVEGADHNFSGEHIESFINLTSQLYKK